ncbi:MAG: hypothetical protein EOP24_46415 [Hyphomicrobiales bacterium]|nr:MAG: hypothetical protein EOP24_46415 [Hyphomicrobiales bacterium]
MWTPLYILIVVPVALIGTPLCTVMVVYARTVYGPGKWWPFEPGLGSWTMWAVVLLCDIAWATRFNFLLVFASAFMLGWLLIGGIVLKALLAGRRKKS